VKKKIVLLVTFNQVVCVEEKNYVR